jgi:hypothetical protein
MKITLRDKVIWAQTPKASAKLVTFPSYHMAVHAIRWCGTFDNSETAGLALIDHCNKVGLNHGRSKISSSFGALAGKKADFHF